MASSDKKPDKPADRKLTLQVLIEDNQVFTVEFLPNQKLHVVTNKTEAHFHIDGTERILRRADGTELPDLQRTIADTGIFEGEVLKYLKKAPRPPREEGFASRGR